MTRRKVEKKAAPVLSEREQRDARFAAMEHVAGKSSAFRRPAEVLHSVRAVSTIFPDVDLKFGVGGWPTNRVGTMHGPSNHGKTVAANGLGFSFLLGGHFFKLMDAERTTPLPWVETLARSAGIPDVARHPGFSASRPDSFEDAVEEARQWCGVIGEGKAKGTFPADMTGLIVVDSLRKLVPQKFFDKVNSDKADGSVDGFGGRAAQIKAALNAAWLDELVPLLDSTGTALLFIARESEDVNADANAKKYGRDFKVTGGKAIIFDSSLVVRVERDQWVKGPEDGANTPIYGERHRLTVSKTKIAGKEDKTQVAHFHTSNGVLVPEGFDRARDIILLGEELEVVNRGGSMYSYDGRRHQGINQAVKWFSHHPENLAELEAKVRAAVALELAEGVVPPVDVVQAPAEPAASEAT